MKIIQEVYKNIDPTDKTRKEKYIEEVWDVLEKSYAKIGGPLKTKEDIMKDNCYWKLVGRPNGTDSGLQTGSITACGIYKRHSDYGRKLILCGCDQTPQGKFDLYRLLREDMDLTDRNAWGEFSEAIEHNLLKWGYTPLPNDIAEKVLGYFGKRLESKDADGFHYSRKIGNKMITKMMFGNPPHSIRECLQRIGKTQLLTEDKVVKFGDTTYPDNGWCVIMCGAPGSGKSTALKNLIPIDAKIFDVDNIKWFTVKHGEISDNVLTVNGKDYPLDGIDPPYNLKNPEYVSFLHKNLKPLNNKIKQSIYNMGINAEEGRLPNVAFDIAGSDINDFENIFDNLAPLGYKFCVVWVFNTLENTLKNNSNRSRTGLKELVIQKYFDVLGTIPSFMARKDLIQYVNDFWIVLPVDYDVETRDGRYKYVHEDNVRKINIKNGMAYLTAELVEIIFEQQAEILNRYR